MYDGNKYGIQLYVPVKVMYHHLTEQKKYRNNNLFSEMHAIKIIVGNMKLLYFVVR